MMRLSLDQIQTITRTVSRLADGTAEVFLFGSRLDDQARGGVTLLERAQLKLELESVLNLPVDIVAQARNAAPTPFQRIARSRAVKLEASL